MEPFAWSSDWQHGGPIIERELIETSPIEPGRWIATAYKSISDGAGGHDHIRCEGPTPLIAAMRAYVAAKLGDEVELP